MRVRSSDANPTWGTRHELEWLTRLQSDNPFAFAMYKRNFYARSDWGLIEPDKVARHLGIRWPPPPPTKVTIN